MWRESRRKGGRGGKDERKRVRNIIRHLMELNVDSKKCLLDLDLSVQEKLEKIATFMFAFDHESRCPIGRHS